ncbi:MAG: long-chain-fatty-acid--CoA ligase [Candidatus Hydrogenedentota bacterium]
MLNLATVLETSAAEFPDKTAVVFRDFRFSYQQINEMANQVANGLKSIGIRKGDKVALSCPNLPYFPIVTYGVLKAGAVLVPLNVLLRPREIAYHLSDSDAVAYICFEGTEQLPLAQAGYAGFKDAENCDHFFIIPTVPFGPSPIDGVKTLGDLMGDQPSTCDLVQTRPDDTAVIIYTSGTTGWPKGAELSHSNLLINTRITRELVNASCDDNVLVVLPLFHSFGHTCLMHVGVMAGATLVLLPRFEPASVLQAMQDENITMFSAVPTMFWDLLNYEEAGKYDLEKIARNLRICSSGAAALPVEVMRQFEEKFNVPILEGYGLSETSPVASFNQMSRPRKPGSIGFPIWGVEMAIVDDNMRFLPAGEKGEIVIRGHNVMKGYYKRDEANEEAFKGGWFHTGDVGTMDDDGYFYIVDRIKDMIIRGGFNVYPRELEEVLLTHPEISLAAVIGIPHEEYGEEAKAYVILKPGSKLTGEDIVAWSKKEMAAYKYPRIVEICESLPLGPTGKILKLELKKKAKEELAAREG